MTVYMNIIFALIIFISLIFAELLIFLNFAFCKLSVYGVILKHFDRISLQNAKINVSENLRNGKVNVSSMIKILLMILFMVIFVGLSCASIQYFSFSAFDSASAWKEHFISHFNCWKYSSNQSMNALTFAELCLKDSRFNNSSTRRFLYRKRCL